MYSIDIGRIMDNMGRENLIIIVMLFIFLFTLIFGGGDARKLEAWLPDHYRQILRSYCVRPFRLLDYGSATLRCKICSLPFLGLRWGGGRGGAIKFCSVA